MWALEKPARDAEPTPTHLVESRCHPVPEAQELCQPVIRLCAALTSVAAAAWLLFPVSEAILRQAIQRTPSRSTAKPRQELGVTIAATASSGGAFEPYKNLLRGDKYTTYIDTSLGTVVMEFADEAASGHAFGGALAAPTRNPCRLT